MAARKKRDRRRRRRGRFGLFYKLLSILVIFAALLIGSVAFFRVNEVTVMGNQRYSAQEIAAASGVSAGDNLFLVNKPQTARAIMKRLPYVKNVTPIRRLPDTLELRVTESAAVAAVEAEGSWWLLDESGKLLEQGDAALRGTLPQVLGLGELTAPALGTRMTVEQELQPKLESLKALLTALSDRGLEGDLTEFIDLSAGNAIYFGYRGCLTVAVPMSGDFGQQAFRLQRVLESFAQRGEIVTGTLDLTYSGKQARLLTGRWLPGSGTTTQIPEGGATDGQPEQSDQPGGGQAPDGLEENA